MEIGAWNAVVERRRGRERLPAADDRRRPETASFAFFDI